MYLDQIAIYLTWPAFILVSWIIIRSALLLYERKYPEDGRAGSEDASELGNNK